ncbi:hypothetical protein [Phreatobacter sp.]|uniref:hypothetical protein n=1 Tax=Phreatobacter sp. TaxID=1966341 RepID=UPI003F71565F
MPAERDADGFALIYRNTRFRRVRFLQLVFWAPALFFLWLAWATRIEDPTNNHVASLVLAPLCALFAVALEVYLRHYVTRAWVSSEAVRIETLATLGRQTSTYPLANVTFSGERRSNPHATMAATGFWLDNSYSAIRVHGRRWPFILDTTVD